MKRIGLHQIDPSGATNGQVPVYDAPTQEFKPGAAPRRGHTHEQTVAAATWTVTHNLGTKPPVTVVLSGALDTLVFTDVKYPDLNTVVVEFPTASTGWVYI